jgi:hypothetical protein
MKRLTARCAKNISPYRGRVLVTGTRINETYINADMEYKAADSMMISAAKWSCFEAPGIRDTRTIRVTMIMVETVVVPTDNAIQEISTPSGICVGIQAGYTESANCVRPAAECNVRLWGFK